MSRAGDGGRGPADGLRLLVYNLATDADDPLLAFTSRWVAALAARAAHVDVLTMRAGRLAVPTNVTVWPIGGERGWGRARRAARFWRLLAGILRRSRPDACFSHMMPAFTVLGAPLLKAARVPVVTWYAHRVVPPRARLAYHLSDLVATSVEEGFAYRADRRLVLGQGIDTAFFAPGPGPPGDGPPLVVSVGRLSPVKDLGTLLRAVARLRAEGRDVTCALVGGPATPADTAYEDELRRLAATLGLGEAAHFSGGATPEEVRTWYRRAAAHVNLAPRGALDKSALEAMSCGRPSLVANESFRATLGPWAGRLLFGPGDPESLAGRLGALLDEPPAAVAAMGADLRARVVAGHDLERLADRLVETLTGLATARRRRGGPVGSRA